MVVWLLAWCPFIFKWVAGHHDVIKWKHFPRYWPFVRGIHRSPVDCPHKGQWRRALMFLWFAPEQTIGQTIGTPVIWDAIALIITVMDLLTWVASPIAAGRHVPFVYIKSLGAELKLVNMLTLYVLNFPEGIQIYIHILCHSSTLTWHG